jgi:inosine triphosphate pyrophosphatase
MNYIVPELQGEAL